MNYNCINLKKLCMKKFKIFLALILFVAATSMAQNEGGQQGGTSDNYLPEAGDIAIGIEAGPILQYFGNMLNGNTFNASPNLQFLNGNTIFVKYFLEDDVAIRARFRALVNNDVFRIYVDDELAQFEDPLSRDLVVDRRTFSSHNYLIGVDYEMRRGYNRLQGYYGGGVIFQFTNSSNTYEYGNAISEIVPVPATANFGTGNIIGNSRVLENKNANNNYAGGLNGFIGVEYFIFPKISIGGELGLSLIYTHYSRTKQIVEYWDGFQVVEEVTLTNPGNRTLRATTVNPALGIYIMFHF
jgi:hypothetical protein